MIRFSYSNVYKQIDKFFLQLKNILVYNELQKRCQIEALIIRYAIYQHTLWYILCRNIGTVTLNTREKKIC